jgi:NAD(P)-dependent dehydrogenase (short-subunit alcohol dehydrogenase family)
MQTMLDGQVVVVIGGAGRLGRAFSAAIAEQNGMAVIADLPGAAAAAVEAADPANRARLSAEDVDVADPASVGSLVERVKRAHGRLDAAVCTFYPRSAGYGQPFDRVSTESFCEHLRLHVGGYFSVAQQFGRFFASQGRGHIVNVASVYGVVAPRFELYTGTTMTVPIEYAASKAAIIHMTKYLAKHFKGSGVRVNAITPGGILDGQPDAFLERYTAHCTGKGMLDASDLTGALVFLLSDMSSQVNGQNVVVDDGFTL